MLGKYAMLSLVLALLMVGGMWDHTTCTSSSSSSVNRASEQNIMMNVSVVILFGLAARTGGGRGGGTLNIRLTGGFSSTSLRSNKYKIQNPHSLTNPQD